MTKKLKKTSILHILLASLMLSFPGKTMAQSKTGSDNFQLGQWLEIQNAVLAEIYNSYVDTLDLKRYFSASIKAALESLDPYTVYVPEEENEDFEMMISKTYGGIGAIISKKVGEYLVIDEVYADSPAAGAGLRCGDEILEVDGVDVKPFTSAETTSRMKGKPGTKVNFKVRKVYTGEVKNIVVIRQKIHLPDVTCYAMLDAETGYIQQEGFTMGVADAVRKAVIDLKSQGMKRLILDLRGNGGGLLSEAVNIVSLFVPKGSVVVSQKGRRGEKSVEQKHVTLREPLDTEIPLMVLINEGSASASEIVAGGLQDMDRATIAGAKSYGKGLVQSMRDMPYGGQMKVTTAHYYTPSGRCVQRLDYSSGVSGAKAFADSLKHEFKTVGGRTVTSAGGITPDIALKSKSYSRSSYVLVYAGVLDRYAMKYVREHKNPAPAAQFRLTDAEWEDFVKYALEQDFDYRPESLVQLEKLKNEIKEDGYDQITASQMEALEKALEVSKEQMIELVRKEVTPLLESEIIARYYFQAPSAKHLLPYDEQLQEALKVKWLF